MATTDLRKVPTLVPTCSYHAGGLPVPGLHSYRPTTYFYRKSASAWHPRVTTEVRKKLYITETYLE
jgi:hypothetical protein